MATYTDNYSLTKPTFAEVADIRTINGNMDTIDDIMHASQVSLADAYDQTATYNTGDVVMYEFLMYKCKEDNVTGNWDATKWERTTAAETGGGEVDFDLFGEASGNPVSFVDGSAAALVKCEMDIEATQSGSGTPSPSNPRPITGHSSVTINVSPTNDTSQGVDTTIQLGDTYYGGTLDVTRGILTVTHATTDVNTVITNRTTSYSKPVFYGEISGMKAGSQTVIAEAFNGIESKLSAQNFANNADNGDCANNSNNTQFFIRADEYTDVPSLKTALGTTKIKYKLATPITVQIPPTTINTLLGQNYVSSEDTEDIDLVYTKATAPIKPNPSGEADGYLSSIELSGEKFEIIKELPTFPTSDGDYKLKLSVSSGVPTLSWVSDT